MKKRVFGILIFLFLINLFAWDYFFELKNREYLKVVFFDVGQGDSIFIETPSFNQILIDGGPSNKVLEKLSKNMPFWDRTLDLIVLTHPDHDHIFGLLEVLKSYEVENILWTGVFKKSAEHKEWVDLIEKEGSNIIISQKDLKIFSKNTEMEVVYPLEVLENEEVRNFNDSSIVLKLDFKESTFLFTGDITSSAERVLKDIDTDLLKVAHHGSKESTSEEFLKETSPIIAVISSGENNSYGHPHKEVLERLKGVEVLRTDKKGDIEIINNGRTFFFD